MRKFTADPQALFRYRGLPPVGLTVSMALQHLVSMIVGCVTPAIIIAHAAALTHHEQVLLIQASLVLSAVTTLLQLFPIGGRFGSGLPVIFGVSFAYLPSMQAIATGRGGMAAVAGAMLVGGVIATLVGLFIKPIRRLFPPVITGTVVFTIGLSLYPTAINYMAGGAGNTYQSVVEERGLTEALVYGSWQNWAIAAFTPGGGVAADQSWPGHMQAGLHSPGHPGRVCSGVCGRDGGPLRCRRGRLVLPAPSCALRGDL